MHFALTNEQAELLLAALDRLIDNDRHPLSRRIRALLKPYPERPAVASASEAIRAAVEGPVPSSAQMKPYRGPLTTLGNAATAKVRVIGHRQLCAIAGGMLGRVRFDPMLAISAPHGSSGSNARSAAAEASISC